MNTIHTTLSFLFFFTFNFLDVFAVPNTHLCHPEQRSALFEFKKELEIKFSCKSYLTDDDSVGPYKTESWKNNTDCCYWDGITCNPRTGKVTEINLSSSCLYGRFHSNTLQNLAFLTILDLSYNELYGQIGSSVGELSHLISLDISYNQFSGQIPFSIGKLSNLNNLTLSGNKFSGQIPSSIGKLSNLTYLALSGNQFSGQIPYSIGNLSRLVGLHFSGNSFVGEIPFTFGRLNQLTSLLVGYNKLSGNFPIAILNLTNLSFLSLSYNQFTGTLPPNITSLSNLEYFHVRNNDFVGTLHSSLSPISSLANNHLGTLLLPSKLRGLSLGSNNFRGPVDFNIFSHLKSLQYLYLSYLNTTTKIDLTAISSLSKSLEALDLSGNHVFATNKKSSVSDPPLQLIIELSLRDCGITEFPEILRTRQNLEYLDISNNKIKGQVPAWLWTLPSLYNLDLSNNNFISFERPAIHGLSSPLQYFFGSKNNFTGNIPSLVCELRSLIILDLSVNDFNGSIPHCLENLKSSLSDLNLRHNHLSGGLPRNVFESLRSIDVGHNQLVGKLPRSLMNCSSLEVLNVESNRINDVFPLWLNSLQNLQILILGSNAFHGPIYQASFRKLQIIDISYNQFSGTLPSDYFVGWSAMSSLGTNTDQSTQKYMGDELDYYSIVLKNKGLEIEIVRILKVLAALDFSGNRFEGEIPDSISLLKELYSLIFSNNAFTGHIPSSMGNLTSLESLDVSQNKLSGEIPQELGTLSFLSYMNFSHNQLVGPVPGGTQFRTQRCSSFANNSGLFGPALDEACSNIHTPSQEQYETRDAKENEEEEEVFSWIAAAIGFGPGIAFGFTIGYILVSHKPEWFGSPFARNKRKSRITATR